MKDFAGSSITYYGLAREILMNKYPRLINVFVILALICMTGLAIFLISDLVSFALNPDYKGASTSLDLKGPENGIIPTTNDKEKSENTSTNTSQSLENTSRQSKEQSPSNLSKMNASLLSSQTAKGVDAASESSSGSTKSSVDKKVGNSLITRHHSSSSSSSSTSSSAKSAKKINDPNNLTNETVTILVPTEQSMNNSQERESTFLILPPIEAANITITNSSNLSSEGQGGILSNEESANSQESNYSEVAPSAVPTSLPLAAIGSSTIPAKDKPAREPVSIIEFKTQAPLSQKSEPALSQDNSVTDGAAVSDNTNKAQSPKEATKKSKLQAAKTKSASSKKSKLAAANQAAKVKETKDKMKANKDRIEQKMKKKAAQLRTKIASN